MPDNPFTAEKERRAAAQNPFTAEKERRAAGPTASEVMRKTAARGVITNALAAPSASGDFLAAASAGAQHVSLPNVLRNIAGMVRNEPSPQPTFSERYAQEREKFPANVLRSIPRPTANEAAAALMSFPSLMPGGESPSDAYGRNLETIEQGELDMRQAHPAAAMAGDAAADAASLVLGRQGTGLNRLIQRAETRLGAQVGAKAAETLAGDLKKTLTSTSMRRLARGAGRSVETGVEAAALDILKDPDADPAETAALAAGGQMVGSGFLASAQGITSGGPLKAGIKVSVAAASVFGMLQVLKSATPGGEDRVLESIETGYDKVALALGLGAASAGLAATRYGRASASLSDQTRTFLDGIATTHRGTVLSVLTDWTEGDEKERATIEEVMTAVAKDPTYSGKNAAERRVVSMLRRRYRTGGGF